MTYWRLKGLNPEFARSKVRVYSVQSRVGGLRRAEGVEEQGHLAPPEVTRCLAPFKLGPGPEFKFAPSGDGRDSPNLN